VFFFPKSFSPFRFHRTEPCKNQPPFIIVFTIIIVSPHHHRFIIIIVFHHHHRCFITAHRTEPNSVSLLIVLNFVSLLTVSSNSVSQNSVSSSSSSSLFKTL
jgi:hypothetical protein